MRAQLSELAEKLDTRTKSVLCREGFNAACAAVKERALQARLPGKTGFARR
jgi:hypothetical protein